MVVKGSVPPSCASMKLLKAGEGAPLSDADGAISSAICCRDAKASLKGRDVHVIMPRFQNSVFVGFVASINMNGDDW